MVDLILDVLLEVFGIVEGVVVQEPGAQHTRYKCVNMCQHSFTALSTWCTHVLRRPCQQLERLAHLQHLLPDSPSRFWTCTDKHCIGACPKKQRTVRQQVLQASWLLLDRTSDGCLASCVVKISTTTDYYTAWTMLLEVDTLPACRSDETATAVESELQSTQPNCSDG